MSSKNDNRHIIVFDTNILYEKVDNRCDFTTFKFNKLFQNIIDAIEQRDLIENVEVMIPAVVWNEILYQRVEGYNQKIHELKGLLERFSFPNFDYNFEEFDFQTHIENCINIYKGKLKKYSVRISELELPNSYRFESIIERAFCKKAPFEGQDKKSDKGFKDALIWESILEFRTNNANTKIYLYSRDGLFNEVLKEEYKGIFGDDIILVNKEEAVLRTLDILSRKYRKEATNNYEEIKLYSMIKNEVSEDFLTELLYEIDIHINISGKIYDLSDIESLEINNITNNTTDENNISTLEYLLEAKINCTVSNPYENNDLEYKNENLEILIKYDLESKNLVINKVRIFSEEFECENYIIGGYQYV